MKDYKFKNLLYKKLIVSSYLLAPFLVTSCSRDVDNQIQEEISEEITNNESDNFFPKLYIEDYYDYIEFDEFACPKFNSDFKMKVIKDVISRVASEQGKIKFSVNQYSSKEIEFNFVWEYQDKKLYKNYSFEIE